MRTETSKLQTSIRDEARRRLSRILREKSYREIGEATGLTAPWLCQFLKGCYLDPEAQKVELLLNYCLGVTGEQPQTLVAECIERLKNRPIWQTTVKISQDTGIATSWINALYRGRLNAPGINKVETLLSYLRKNANVLS